MFPAAFGNAGTLQHIIVIDAERDVCEFVKSSLQGLGCLVSIAQNAEDAAAISRRSALDLTIVDAALTDQIGIDLALEPGEQLPAVIMTSEAHLSARLSAAGWQFLLKPFSPRQLLDQTRHVIGRLRESRETVSRSSGLLRLTLDESRRQRERAATMRKVAHRLIDDSADEAIGFSLDLAIIRAAEAWASALEAIKGADECHRPSAFEECLLEDAESALYEAILNRRNNRQGGRKT